MLHSLRQESVDAVDPCGSAVLRQILIFLLEVKEREVLFLMWLYVAMTNEIKLLTIPVAGKVCACVCVCVRPSNKWQAIHTY
jgi:hypothetical protein